MSGVETCMQEGYIGLGSICKVYICGMYMRYGFI